MSRFWRRHSDDSERDREAEELAARQKPQKHVIANGKPIVSLLAYRDGMTKDDFLSLCNGMLGCSSVNRTHVHTSLAHGQFVQAGDLLAKDGDGFHHVLRVMDFPWQQPGDPMWHRGALQ